MKMVKILDIISALACIFMLFSWFVMKSPQYLLAGAAAYGLQMIAGIASGVYAPAAIGVDLIFFIIGWFIGMLVSVPSWLCGVLVIAVFELITTALSIGRQ